MKNICCAIKKFTTLLYILVSKKNKTNKKRVRNKRKKRLISRSNFLLNAN